MRSPLSEFMMISFPSHSCRLQAKELLCPTGNDKPPSDQANEKNCAACNFPDGKHLVAKMPTQPPHGMQHDTTLASRQQHDLEGIFAQIWREARQLAELFISMTLSKR